MVRLLNIRLSKQDALVVSKLRRKGVVVSDLVRSALHEEYAKHEEKNPTSPADVFEWLHKKYPAPAKRESRTVDAADRKQVSAYIRSRLKSRKITRKSA